jgi:hypothetical protein
MSKLLALGAACHQITFIVVESWLFRGLRDAAAARSEHLGRLLSCHLCFGTWVGFVLAALFRPRFAGPSRALPAPVSATASWAIDSFVIALVARLLNETIASVRGEVEVKKREAQVLDAVASAEQEAQRAG